MRPTLRVLLLMALLGVAVLLDLAIVVARQHTFDVVVPLISGEITINVWPDRITVWYHEPVGDRRVAVLPNPAVWAAVVFAGIVSAWATRAVIPGWRSPKA